MNYRHAFYAGSFTDVMKHAVFAMILARMTAKPKLWWSSTPMRGSAATT